MARIVFVAEQGAWFLRRQLEHLCALRDRFRKLELSRIDSYQIVVAAGSGRSAAVGGCPQRPQMDVINPFLGESVAERGLGKTRARGIRHRTHVDHSLNAGVPDGSNEVADGRAFIPDGKDTHRAYDTASAFPRKTGI